MDYEKEREMFQDNYYEGRMLSIFPFINLTTHTPPSSAGKLPEPLKF